jgi:GGDEF domain-containing protein
MNSLNCRNESKGGVCVLAFIVKILVIVVVAEMAIHLYSIAAGGGADAADLAKSILRMLIVAAGVYFFFGRDKSEQGSDEGNISEDATEVVAITDEEDFNSWPNIDALTRTSNERGLTISILELMALADRYGHKLSIGMIKVDGIEGLENPAKNNVFMVLLPESDINGADIVATRLRENLEQGKTEDYADAVSVWIGMTEFQRGEDLQSLLDRVEAAADQSREEENGICIKKA